MAYECTKKYFLSIPGMYSTRILFFIRSKYHLIFHLEFWLIKENVLSTIRVWQISYFHCHTKIVQGTKAAIMSPEFSNSGSQMQQS